MLTTIFSTLVFSFNTNVANPSRVQHPNHFKVAQVSINKNPSFEDPRMTKIKKSLQANYGDLKPLHVYSRAGDNLGSMRRENIKIFSQKFNEFILELGGRPVSHTSDNFSISVNVLQKSGDSSRFTETYTVEFSEAGVGLITSHTTNVSCGQASMLFHKGKPDGCLLTLDDAEEILLGLNFD